MQLQSGQPLIVHAGKAEHLRQVGAVGIIAQRVLHQIHAGQIQMVDRLGLFVGNQPAVRDDPLGRNLAGDLLVDVLFFRFQNVRQLLGGAVGIGDLSRNNHDRRRRNIRRQHFAVDVQNIPAQPGHRKIPLP